MRVPANAQLATVDALPLILMPRTFYARIGRGFIPSITRYGVAGACNYGSYATQHNFRAVSKFTI